MNSDDIVKLLDEQKLKITEYKKNNLNEQQTKLALIQPFFTRLGWDFTNPFEVIPEDDDGSGKKPDYGFYDNGKIKIYVEAKSLKKNINDKRIINEKLQYCINSRVDLLIITNGNEYNIHYTKLNSDNKILARFNLLEDADINIIKLLYKDYICSDKLLKYARDMFVLTTVKNSVQNLFESPSKELITIINKQIKNDIGHSFESNDLKDTISNITIEINLDLNYENIGDEENISVTPDNDNIYTIDTHFQSKPKSYKLYNELISKLKQSGINFDKKVGKMYIALTTNGKNFCEITAGKDKLRMFIDLKFNELSEKETLKFRDVNGVGHLATGSIQTSINDDTDIDRIFPVIQKSYKNKEK